MPDANPTREQSGLPILFNLPNLCVDDHGVPVDLGDRLTVVTADGRPLRVISLRSTGYFKAEITVTEEAG